MRKKLKLTMQFFDRKWPVLAIGLISPTEFVLSLWLVTFRLEWNY